MLDLVTELSEDDEAYSFNITFHGPGDRTFVLSAENQELMEEWMKAVTCASYDYMKVMVTELQKQVDELTGIVFSQNVCILTDID